MEPLETRRLLAGVVLNEVEVNTPGPHGPYEYVEIKGDAGATLDNHYFVSVEGDADPESSSEPGGPGAAELVVNLSGRSLGTSGLLVITGTAGDGHPTPSGTTVVTTPMLDAAGTALENGSNSFLLVFSTTPIVQGTDYDSNDDGALGLPSGAVIVDAVGWFDHRAADVNAANDKVYGGVSLTQSSDSPDAATRFPADDTPRSFDAWYNGETPSDAPADNVSYDAARTSLNFPSGGRLTPGAANVPEVVLPPARLSELKVNPPTATDAPYEYAELRGAPGQTLARLFFVSVDGDDANAGKAKLVVNLSGATLGSDGVLVVQQAGGHAPPAAAAVNVRSGFTLDNGTNSFLLVASLDPIVENADYDANDDGVLELPDGAVLVDAVGWFDGSSPTGSTSPDRVYGGVRLSQSAAGAPDAATRFPNNDAFLSAAAWYNGDLAGGTGVTADRVDYSSTGRSANFPDGGVLTPGGGNVPVVPNRAPQNVVPTSASTGQNQPLVFGDARRISVTDADATIHPIRVTLTATNGTLTLARTTGLAVTGGADGTAELTVRGTLADLNAALDGLTFTPAPNYRGPAVVSITADDLGNSGSGGAQTDTDLINVTVAPSAIAVGTSKAAYVRDGTYSTKNYGSAPVLEVKRSNTTGSNRQAYLRFDLSAVATITSAKLRLFGKLSGATTGGVQTSVRPASNTTWSESGLTWNNKPATGAATLATVNVTGTTGRWYEFDVTDFLRAELAAGRKVVTLVLKNPVTSSAYTTFNSDEATGNRPLLEVTA